MSNATVNWVQRRPLGTFFALSWTISWLIWAPLFWNATRHANLLTLPAHHFFGALGPCLAALIVTFVTSGVAGLKKLLASLMDWRGQLPWLLIALCGPLGILALAAIGVGWIRGDHVNWLQFGQSDEFPGIGLVGLLCVHTLTFGVGEEMGWRGFALPRLQARHNALVATTLLTAGWAVWHLPAFWYRPGYVSMSAGAAAGWLFSLATGSVILTWLYNSSRGSLLVAVLFHGSIDVAFTSKLAGGDVAAVMGATIIVWAIVVLLFTGASHLSRSPRVAEPPSGDLIPAPGLR